MGLSSVTLLGMSASESTSGGFGGLHQSILGRTNLCPVSIVDLDVVVVVVVAPPPPVVTTMLCPLGLSYGHSYHVG